MAFFFLLSRNAAVGWSRAGSSVLALYYWNNGTCSALPNYSPTALFCSVHDLNMWVPVSRASVQGLVIFLFVTSSAACSSEWIHLAGNGSHAICLPRNPSSSICLAQVYKHTHTHTQADTQMSVLTHTDRKNHAPLEGTYNRGTDQMQWEKVWMEINSQSQPQVTPKPKHFCSFSFIILSTLTFLHFSQLMSQLVPFISPPAALYIKGNDVTKLASMAKLKGGRLAREVSDSCLQFWGGMGFTSDVLVSRFYR